MTTLGIIGFIILLCWLLSIPDRIEAKKQQDLLKKIIEILEENQNKKPAS